MAKIHTQCFTYTRIRRSRIRSPSWSPQKPTGIRSSLIPNRPCSPVLTTSLRMWVVENPTPGSTPPTTPGPGPSAHPTPMSLSHPSVPHPPHLSTSFSQASPPFQPLSATPSVSASALPGQHMSGRLSGVVSLTDILNLFARASGLHPTNPEEARRQRRGSSSSSRSGAGISGFRGSEDSARSGMR